MKTVGKFLKEARIRKKYSLAKLESLTKIKKEFLSALEEESWEALPEYPVLTGFVKNTAKALGVNERSAVAFLRRDYPPKTLSVNPKPDVGSKFIWSPRITFLASITAVAIFILGYLGIQYSKFVAPPALTVIEPKDGEVVKNPFVKVVGQTDPEATVEVNNQPVLLSEDGKFEVEIAIFEGTQEVVVKASSRSGKETIVRRKIKPELK